MYIMNNLPKIQSVAPIVKRMDQFDAYVDTTFVGSKKPTFQNKIDIANVSFSYHEEQSVLANVTLEIEKGKKYAIVGESGCGKSTLVKLLMGYYSNFMGQITFDQTSIMDCEVSKISELASIIHQNVYMFDKSIKENICLFHDYSSEALDQAISVSGVDKFLPVMQDNLNTLVGENGANLSGGQRQRIAIARALVKGTPLLILDEGTSAIDLQTSNDIEQNLLHKEELTLITITHKLSEDLLGLYDQIIYMENGHIIEKGSYQELYSAKNGFYNFCVA
jgi:ABC-type bacteriocin/lantibiotic exporter with double-glycine peptidase domain